MNAPRMLAVVAVMIGSVAATIANVGHAANDPRGIDPNGDEIGRSGTFMRNPEAVAPIRAVKSAFAAGNPLWGIPIASLRATLERPLFSPSRRPPMAAVVPPPVAPVQVVAPPPPEPEQPQLSLLGTIAGNDEGYAVFVNTTTHDIIRLRTGEGHDGWVLQSVGGREAVLEKNHRTAVVALPLPEGSKK